MVLKPYITKRTAEAPIRRALFARLQPALAPIPIYNGNANPDQPYPYAIIGEPTDGPDIGTKTSEADNRVIMFHCYTEEDGYDQVSAMKDAMLAAFKEPLVLDDPTWNLYSIELLGGGRTLRIDPPTGPRYAHAAFSMRFKVESKLT